MKKTGVPAKTVRFLCNSLIGMIFPSRCISCGRLIDGHDYEFCPECLDGARSLMLAKPFRVPHTELCTAPFKYAGPVRSAIINFKFRDRPHYDRALARYIAYSVWKFCPERPEVITYVPLSDKRKRKRKYDQVELLARRLSELTGLPAVKALDKTGDNTRQSELRASQRAGNVLGAYALNENAALLRGRRVLLLDDIVTTGATMSEAARTLAGAEPSCVIGAAAAKTGKYRKKRLKLRQR